MDENQNSLNPDDEPLENLAPQAPQQPNTVEDVVAYAKQLEDRNQKLYARAKKAEEQSKTSKEELAALRNPPLGAAEPQRQFGQPSGGDDIGEVLALRSEGYSDAEILRMRQYSKKANVSILELAQDPLVKSGIEAERSKAQVEQATPPPSGQAIVPPAPAQEKKGKSFDDWQKDKRSGKGV